jgi:hypothetical protein
MLQVRPPHHSALIICVRICRGCGTVAKQNEFMLNMASLNLSRPCAYIFGNSSAIHSANAFSLPNSLSLSDVCVHIVCTSDPSMPLASIASAAVVEALLASASGDSCGDVTSCLIYCSLALDPATNSLLPPLRSLHALSQRASRAVEVCGLCVLSPYAHRADGVYASGSLPQHTACHWVCYFYM